MPVDAAAGGALMGKSIEVAKALLEENGLQQLSLAQREGNSKEGQWDLWDRRCGPAS